MTIQPSFQINALYEARLISNEELAGLLALLPQTLLLYDDGTRVEPEDFRRYEDPPLQGEQAEAAQELYRAVVALCREYPEPEQYETIQDCLSLQFDLWQAGMLSLHAWTGWLAAAIQGTQPLPSYDYTKLLGSVPEGYMIQDYHDELLYRLEQNSEDAWANQQIRQLYEQLGV
ncbi:hypothetical protein Q5741_20600 [Paenibacillus sp. JX-17]|uniref:DUF2247 family protein n=1 Tax=Paenibacillus lacisoli TaxID=3064525 RepID=A0ABT9CMG0_9BACL|nr:hypothetical protein [Paenibacillus sp. JX-17]MDO7908788.1 hypothetical protein [Paenibacillus sp. JX-17]